MLLILIIIFKFYLRFSGLTLKYINTVYYIIYNLYLIFKFQKVHLKKFNYHIIKNDDYHKYTFIYYLTLNID